MSEKLGKHVVVTPADYTVFRESLTGKLDAIYAQLDEVFASSSRRAHVTFADARVALDSAERPTLHFRDEKTVPFDFQAVAAACWHCAQKDALRASEHGEVAEVRPMPSTWLISWEWMD